MAKVIQLPQEKSEPERPKRVAAYARISMEDDRLMHSLSTQISYYSGLIQKTPGWEFAGIYADRFVTGTLISKRDEFQKMIKEAEAGKIDIILTKSIQRFARNTVDLLASVRHLKELGVEVRFEREGISTFSGDGELMLTILASFAQEEIRNLSENVEWACKKKMNAGEMPTKARPLGYTFKDRKHVIISEEAEVVRRIFNDYASGKSITKICKELEAEGIRSKNGAVIDRSAMCYLIKNPVYIGHLLMQKTFRTDPIGKKRMVNHGEVPMVYVENDHEPIIDVETFDRAQALMEKRSTLYYGVREDHTCTHAFEQKVRCPEKDCMFSFGDVLRPYIHDGLWRCSDRGCPMYPECDHKTVPDMVLRQSCARAMGLNTLDEKTAKKELDSILVSDGGKITVNLKNGKIYEDLCFGIDEDLPRTFDNSYTFSKKLRCGRCGRNYRIFAKEWCGKRHVFLYCKLNSDNTPIYFTTLKYRVAEAAGWDEFSYERFKKEIDYIDMDKPYHMIIHFTDGRVREAEYYVKGRGVKHDLKEYNRQKNTRNKAAYNSPDTVTE